MDAAHPTARRNRSIAGWDRSGTERFWTIWPSVQQAIFAPNASDRQMLNAVSELGVLLLLLLTGMETDLALVRRVRRTALITSAAGIVIPFACGYVLGEMLPDSVLPDPNQRLLTSLFLATALSISSVKIVAAVLREVDYLRRNLGQVILAAAILDDTIGWTILAFIGGLAAQGRIVIGPVLFSVLGTAAFLAFCFTIGRRWVAPNHSLDERSFCHRDARHHHHPRSSCLLWRS